VGLPAGAESHLPALQHPNATTNSLFMNALASATTTYGEAGAGGTGMPYALLRALRGTPEAHMAAGAVNPEASALFRPHAYGVYRFRVTVHDGCSEASMDVEVDVQCPPTPIV